MFGQDAADEELLDYTFLAEYSPQLGFKVAVDGAVNLPKAVFAKAVFSLLPPGSFYRDTALTDAVEFTRSHDFNAPLKHPAWIGEPHTFAPVAWAPHLCVVVDVMAMKVKGKKAGQLEPVGWAVIPVFAGDKYVRAGAFQAPLYEHPVKRSILDEMQKRPVADVLADAVRDE